MTEEEIIDLLAFASVYDNTVTLGKAETAAWYLAVQRVPFTLAQQAVVEHYTAAREPGADCPRITPGHVFGYYQAHNRVYDKSVPAIEAPPARPEFVAQCRAQIDALVTEAVGRFAIDDAEPDAVPRWRSGMDKQALALAQVEACRRRRAPMDPALQGGGP